MSRHDERTLSDLSDAERAELAARITERHYQRKPELETRYGSSGRERCREDAETHLKYLMQAVRSEAPELFVDYVLWASVMLEARDIPCDDLIENLRVLEEVVGDAVPASPAIAESISAAIEQLAGGGTSETLIDPSRRHAALARDYLDALLAGDRRKARGLILDAVASGVHVREIYLDVFQPVQHEVGRLWQTNQITVGDEHFCTAATQWVMSELYPHIFTNQERKATFVAASVGNEMHEIGIRMVADFLEIEGWDTHYLGARTPPSSIVDAICSRNADVVGLSVTISHHVKTVTEIIRHIRSDARCRQTKILVGGYPFLRAPNLWRNVGADGFARDAEEAVSVAQELLDQLRSR